MDYSIGVKHRDDENTESGSEIKGLWFMGNKMSEKPIEDMR